MVSYFNENTPEIVLRSLFTKFDSDGSGTLTKNETSNFLINDLGFDNETAEECLLIHDNDGSGTMSYEEFTTWLHSGEGTRQFDDASTYYKIHAAVEMFKKYDTDGKDSLDVTKFRKVLEDMNEEAIDAEEAIKALDMDGNGVISFPEFLKWLHWV